MIKLNSSKIKAKEITEKFDAGRGAIQLAVLGILLRGKQCGYQIGKEMRIADVSLKVNFGVLYPLLERMEKKGLIKGHQEKGRGPLGTHVYEITPAGRKALRRSEETWLRMIQQIKRLIRA